MSSKIKLSKEKRDGLISVIKKYFLTEREEDLGDLAAGLILDFFIEKLSPEFYNQGVYDSYVFMTEKVEDLLGIQKQERSTPAAARNKEGLPAANL